MELSGPIDGASSASAWAIVVTSDENEPLPVAVVRKRDADAYEGKQKLQVTPKKIKRAIAEIAKQGDLEYSLTAAEKDVFDAGLSEMPLPGKEKTKELAIRWGKAIEASALGSPGKHRPHDSPGKQKELSQRLLESDWAGKMHSTLGGIYREASGGGKSDWPLIHRLDHLTQYVPGEGGLHMVDPSHKDWYRLEQRTENYDTKVFGAMIRDSVKSKFSSFWPIGTTERDITKMGFDAESVVWNGNMELVTVDLPNNKVVHAIRYHREGVINSFFPIFCCHFISKERVEEEFTFNFVKHEKKPVQVEVKITAGDLLPQLVAKKAKIAFESSKQGMVYFECSEILHSKGMPKALCEGFIFKVLATEVGHTFPKPKDVGLFDESLSSPKTAGGRAASRETPSRPKRKNILFGAKRVLALGGDTDDSDDDLFGGGRRFVGIPAIGDLNPFNTPAGAVADDESDDDFFGIGRKFSGIPAKGDLDPFNKLASVADDGESDDGIDFGAGL